MSASVTKTWVLGMQVCVPNDWTDEQVIAFAEKENPCGTTNGWQIRKQGDEALAGALERVPCNGDPTNNAHIMLDA